LAKEFKSLRLKKKEADLYYDSKVEPIIRAEPSFVMKHAVVNRIE